MSDLEIQAYNIGFGDAILVRVPMAPPQGDRHFRDILIDGGNSLTKAGGDDAVLLQAMSHLHTLTGGRLDLYVMTHEHLDHVQGPLLLKKETGQVFTAERVWMTASSAPGYYDTHPEAKKKMQLAQGVGRVIDRQKTLIAAAERPYLEFVLQLNNPRATQDCVTHIRDEIPTAPDRVHYIHADLTPAELEDRHRIPELEIEVWAPEEDTSDYYGHFRPLAVAGPVPEADTAPLDPAAPKPPPGVAMADFYRLIKSREAGLFANALMIDKAANNSSIVLLLKWRGRRLLFAADAEERSWRHIRKRLDLASVDFLKISHHGSENGTPREVLEALLGDGGGQRPTALISTIADQHSGVPDDALLTGFEARSRLIDTRDSPRGEAVTVKIPPIL